MLLQLLLRAMWQCGRFRLRLILLPAVALVAAVAVVGAGMIAAGSAGALDVQSLHAALTTSGHLLAASSLANDGGPPNP